mgnify:CR=1 FL=1
MTRDGTIWLRNEMIWGCLVFVLILVGCYLCYLLRNKYGAATEHAIYQIPPKHDDDTLRVAVIGDSWAFYHDANQCDTLFESYARQLMLRPVKCFSKGHNGQKTNGIYDDMFADRPVKYEWERAFCTQPLLEQHPDYCVIMAGINDLCSQVSPNIYAANYQMIIQLLLANSIRPVVMEIPKLDVPFACRHMGFQKYVRSRLFSFVTGAGWNDVTVYQKALRSMLATTGLGDSVLFISASDWNRQASPFYTDDRFHLTPQGYEVLDSCIGMEIVEDLNKTFECKY